MPLCMRHETKFMWPRDQRERSSRLSGYKPEKNKPTVQYQLPCQPCTFMNTLLNLKLKSYSN